VRGPAATAPRAATHARSDTHTPAPSPTPEPRRRPRAQRAVGPRPPLQLRSCRAVGAAGSRPQVPRRCGALGGEAGAVSVAPPPRRSPTPSASVWLSTRGGDGAGGQEGGRAAEGLTEKGGEAGRGRGAVGTRQLRLEPQTFPPAPTPLPPAPAAAAAAAAATPLWRPGTEPAGTPLGPKVSRLPSPERPICCWRKARGGRRDPDAGERRPVPDANLAPARQTGVSAGGDGGGWGEGGGRFCCPVHLNPGRPGPPTPSRRARGGGCVWGRGGVGGGGEARSTPTAGPPWAPPVAGHQVYPSSGTKKHPTGKKRKKKKKRKNREKNPPYHGAGAGPLGNRGGGQRRVPHDHAVRDGGEAAPHPSTPPVPTTSGAPHRARPSRGRAAGYREPTEAPAALRYRYV
ncbi:unnamed protein product, partial [Bubo scandiacus]